MPRTCCGSTTRISDHIELLKALKLWARAIVGTQPVGQEALRLRSGQPNGLVMFPVWLPRWQRRWWKPPRYDFREPSIIIRLATDPVRQCKGADIIWEWEVERSVSVNYIGTPQCQIQFRFISILLNAFLFFLSWVVAECKHVFFSLSYSWCRTHGLI